MKHKTTIASCAHFRKLVFLVVSHLEKIPYGFCFNTNFCWLA